MLRRSTSPPEAAADPQVRPQQPPLLGPSCLRASLGIDDVAVRHLGDVIGVAQLRPVTGWAWLAWGAAGTGPMAEHGAVGMGLADPTDIVASSAELHVGAT